MNDHAMLQSSADGSEYSHPNAAVRHSYPVAVEDASLSTAIGLLMRTMPYALARFGVMLAGSIVTIIWYVVAFGGWALLGSKITPIAGFIWFIACAVVYGYLWNTLVKYFLYLLKAGHIAVLTELITKGQISDGNEGMFQYGKRIVTERFGQMNAMFALDLMVQGIVRAFTNTLDWISNLIPIPGLGDVMAIAKPIIRGATSFIDETILSYSLARNDSDVFRSSRDGIIYYAQNSKEVLKTGLWIAVLDKVTAVLAWIVMMAPAFVIGAILPDSMKGAGFVFTMVVAALFAWNLRAAFLQPLFLVMVMIKFHVCTKNQPINLEWDANLSSVSTKFVELKEKIGAPASAAVSAVTGVPVG